LTISLKNQLFIGRSLRLQLRDSAYAFEGVIDLGNELALAGRGENPAANT